MRKFQHIETPLRVFSGDDCLSGLERELARLGVSRAVIFTGQSLSKSALLDKVRDGMGACFGGIYAGVKAHTPRTGVEDAHNALREFDADAVVAVGGGSAVVTARAASIYLAEGVDLDAMCTRRDANGRMRSPYLKAAKIPQIVVPTTPNTAMVKAGSAVFDVPTGERKALFDPKTRAQSIFLHPDLLNSAPLNLVISSSLDTFTLAIEGLLSKSGDAMSDAFLMQAVRLLAQGLPHASQNSGDDLRLDMAMSAIMCGRGTDHAGAGAATVLGHAIGANHKVENGIAKAVLMPHVLRFNAASASAGIAKVATALGLAHAPSSIEEINTTLGAVFTSLNVPDRLRDFGVPRNALAAIAMRGLDDWFLQGNPRPIRDVADLLTILDAAW